MREREREREGGGVGTAYINMYIYSLLDKQMLLHIMYIFPTTSMSRQLLHHPTNTNSVIIRYRNLRFATHLDLEVPLPPLEATPPLPWFVPLLGVLSFRVRMEWVKST